MAIKLWKLMEDGCKNFKPIRIKYCELPLTRTHKPCGCALGTLYLQASNGKVKDEWLPWRTPGTKWLTDLLKTKKDWATHSFDGQTDAKRKGMKTGTIGGMIEWLFENKGWSREKISKFLKEKKV